MIVFVVTSIHQLVILMLNIHMIGLNAQNVERDKIQKTSEINQTLTIVKISIEIRFLSIQLLASEELLHRHMTRMTDSLSNKYNLDRSENNLHIEHK